MRDMSFCIIMSLLIITMTISCTSVSPVTKSKMTTKGKLASEESKRYPDLESAIIKYKVSGMNNGTETVYIGDWGRRDAIYKEFTTKMMGKDVERNCIKKGSGCCRNGSSYRSDRDPGKCLYP